jgi:hypothetical protein
MLSHGALKVYAVFSYGPRILRPRRNQAPSNERQFAAWLFGMLADDGNRPSGSDVIARPPVIFDGGVEVFRDELLAMRETIAATHKRDYVRLG